MKTALLASGLSVLSALQMDDKLNAWACQAGLSVKNRPASAGEVSLGFHPWVGKMPWRRAWQSTLFFKLDVLVTHLSVTGLKTWGT